MTSILDFSDPVHIAWDVLAVGVGILGSIAFWYFSGSAPAMGSPSWISIVLFGMLGLIAVGLGLARLL